MIFAKLYKHVFKPFVFRLDPEFVHDRINFTGKALGQFRTTRKLTRKLFAYQNSALEQTVCEIKFKNPVGLAAGFDKNAELLKILPEVGFGFAEVGSITGQYCAGNPRPRLWRLKNSHSLLVYYGLKNEGAKSISIRLAGKRFSFPVGISVAKTNCKETAKIEAGIADYVFAFEQFAQKQIGDYFTINISCPNAFGGEPFTDAPKLTRLLDAVTSSEFYNPKIPVFLKMPAELSFEEVDKLVEVAGQFKIAGFIATNLAKNRANKNIKDQNFSGKGGMSGKIVQQLSDNLVAYLYKNYGREFVIIGCGGIFTAEDAYRKIRLGSSLLQMITGMIYNGPQVVGEINRGLADLLKRDGFENISQAIGADNK